VTGVTVSIVFGGVMTLLTAAVVGFATPVIRSYTPPSPADREA
jgi:hypothetical protein